MVVGRLLKIPDPDSHLILLQSPLDHPVYSKKIQLNGGVYAWIDEVKMNGITVFDEYVSACV